MKIVAVAFRIDKENSISYCKFKNPKSQWERFRQYMRLAYDQGADFVSIRFIKEGAKDD